MPDRYGLTGRLEVLRRDHENNVPEDKPNRRTPDGDDQTDDEQRFILGHKCEGIECRVCDEA